MEIVPRSRLHYRGCFIRTQLFFRTLPSRAHTSAHTSRHHPETVRMPWRKRHARFESSGRAAGSGVHPPWSCMRWMLRQSVACRGAPPLTLTAWPGRVAQALRAGCARAPWSLHTMLAPVCVSHSQFFEILKLTSLSAPPLYASVIYRVI